MKKIRGLCLPVILGAVLMSQHAHAADNLTFKGKLIIPACTVQNAEVNWGDIEIQKLVEWRKSERLYCPDDMSLSFGNNEGYDIYIGSDL